ncbi:MAG: diguanylate cyclase, partial [Clostridiales bacterium]
AKGELIRYEMTNSKFSIVLIKIKNLNYYIDKYGLKCSDYINKEIAKLLVDNTRCTDNIAKWDDDKFILLLTETILVKAKNFVERIKEIIIDKDIFFNGHLIELDLIFGLSEIDKEMKIEDCIKYTSELMRNKEVQGDSTLLIGSP